MGENMTLERILEEADKQDKGIVCTSQQTYNMLSTKAQTYTTQEQKPKQPLALNTHLLNQQLP